MKEKLLAVFVVFVMMACFVPATLTSAATEVEGSNLYVYSDMCSDDAFEYALSSYVGLAKTYLDGNGMTEYTKIYMGYPFTIENTNSPSSVYYFPLYAGGEIFATMCVYVDYEQTENVFAPVYGGIVTPFLVDELNDLSTSSQNLYVNFSYSDDEVVVYRQNATDPSRMPVTSFSSRGYIRLSSVLDSFDVQAAEGSAVVASADPLRVFLSLSIIETQGNDSWCSPYCCAAIIRYLNGSTSAPRAIDLLNIVYDNPTTSHTFGVAEVYEVADYWGYSPVQYVGQLSEYQVKRDLMSGKPIFVAMDIYDYDTSSYTSRHAFVLRGADFVYGTYSFWNPWYTNYVACDSSNVEIFDSGSNCRFTWHDCFYDW